jgi:hypothetical protein
MKITVTNVSQPLSSLFSIAQKKIIEESSPKYSLDNVLMFQVITAWATIYFENTAPATTTEWFSLEEWDSISIPVDWFWDLQVIWSAASVDVRVLST